MHLKMAIMYEQLFISWEIIGRPRRCEYWEVTSPWLVGEHPEKTNPSLNAFNILSPQTTIDIQPFRAALPLLESHPGYRGIYILSSHKKERLEEKLILVLIPCSPEVGVQEAPDDNFLRSSFQRVMAGSDWGKRVIVTLIYISDNEVWKYMSSWRYIRILHEKDGTEFVFIPCLTNHH